MFEILGGSRGGVRASEVEAVTQVDAMIRAQRRITYLSLADICFQIGSHVFNGCTGILSQDGRFSILRASFLNCFLSGYVNRHSISGARRQAIFGRLKHAMIRYRPAQRAVFNFIIADGRCIAVYVVGYQQPELNVRFDGLVVAIASAYR